MKSLSPIELASLGPVLSPKEVGALELLELLGEGEGAEVYRAVAASGESYAVKIARAGREGALGREARFLSLVAGPHVVGLLGAGKFKGRVALALELLEHPSLADCTFRDEEERVRVAGAVLWGIGQALKDLGRAGIVHGDVKPHNIVLAKVPRLIDFGLATWTDEPARGGTPRYLPPHELERSGQARDLYALCLSVAEVLSPPLKKEGYPVCLEGVALPEPFSRLLLPILTGPQHLRPGLSWLLSECEECGMSESPVSAQVGPRLGAAYLRARGHEVFRAARLSLGEDDVAFGAVAREMLSRHQTLGSVFSGIDLGDRETSFSRELLPLTMHGAARLSFDALGPLERVPVSTVGSDERLLGWLYTSLAQLDVQPELTRPSVDRDVVELALALARHPVEPDVLREIESKAQQLPEHLVVEGARRLHLGGESYRARQLLESLTTPLALVQRAHICRQQGQLALADELLRKAEEGLAGLNGSTDEQAVLAHRAVKARLCFDRGDYLEALALAGEGERSAQLSEVSALCQLALGNLDAASDALLLGQKLACDEEQAARLVAVRAMVAHQSGEPEPSIVDFRAAADSAQRLSAQREEGTYLTGLSASASDAGRLSLAMDAAARAGLLFEASGEPGKAARCVLSEASVAHTLGLLSDLEQAARRGRRLARVSGDARCEAYFELLLADGLPEKGARQEAALRADALLKGSGPDDQVRVQSRLLECTGSAHVTSQLLEQTSVEAQIEWWKASARLALLANAPELVDAKEILKRISAISVRSADSIALGPLLFLGTELAHLTGQLDVARLLFSRGRSLSDKILRGTTGDLHQAATRLDWVSHFQSGNASSLGVEHLADVERLVRVLGGQRGFRALLTQVLDLMLLWTGVERGVILLPAPGDRLVVRAARNLNQTDLSGPQLEFSRSMAARAMAEGRPVVAVDAAGDPGSGSRSVHALHLRSVLAVPLSAHGDVLGVVYLDDRTRRSAFGERELSWVKLISTLAAVAISSERDRLTLRRSARKAARAKARVSEELAKKEQELELANRQLVGARAHAVLRGNYKAIVGRGKKMSEVLALVDRLTDSELPVLIEGESGTGKELIARAIVDNGPRRGKPLIAENCSAVPETLLESTLFGHQRGAFTGASRDRAGLFQLASGGTLFLDEIGEMSLAMQSKLLRVLQEGVVRPVGGERTIKVDVRVIAATHRDLTQMVSEGTFREDLYYRLRVVPISLPALRERPEDIDTLLDHFVRIHDPGGNRKITDGVRRCFQAFDWPGNVRQLENEVRRMLVLGSDELTVADLGKALSVRAQETHASLGATTLREKLDVLSRSLLTEALKESDGNRSQAASALGISRFGLQKMMKRLGLEGSEDA